MNASRRAEWWRGGGVDPETGHLHRMSWRCERSPPTDQRVLAAARARTSVPSPAANGHGSSVPRAVQHTARRSVCLRHADQPMRDMLHPRRRAARGFGAGRGAARGLSSRAHPPGGPTKSRNSSTTYVRSSGTGGPADLQNCGTAELRRNNRSQARHARPTRAAREHAFLSRLPQGTTGLVCAFGHHRTRVFLFLSVPDSRPHGALPAMHSDQQTRICQSGPTPAETGSRLGIGTERRSLV